MNQEYKNMTPSFGFGNKLSTDKSNITMFNESLNHNEKNKTSIFSMDITKEKTREMSFPNTGNENIFTMMNTNNSGGISMINGNTLNIDHFNENKSCENINYDDVKNRKRRRNFDMEEQVDRNEYRTNSVEFKEKGFLDDKDQWGLNNRQNKINANKSSGYNNSFNVNDSYNNEDMFFKKSKVGNALSDTKNILNNLNFNNIPSKDILCASINEQRINSRENNLIEKDVLNNVGTMVSSNKHVGNFFKNDDSILGATTMHHDEDEKKKENFMRNHYDTKNYQNNCNYDGNSDTKYGNNYGDTYYDDFTETRPFGNTLDALEEKKVPFQESCNNNNSGNMNEQDDLYVQNRQEKRHRGNGSYDRMRLTQKQREEQIISKERLKMNEYLMQVDGDNNINNVNSSNNYGNSDMFFINDDDNNNSRGNRKEYMPILDKKSLERIVTYNKQISFDDIDVDLDKDVIDLNDLRHHLFLCALNFHLNYWAEKVILFYPHNEKINKYCNKIIKIKNQFDETYDFTLFEQIHVLSRRLLKTLDINCCIYESVLFLSAENMYVLKNAKLSLFDAFNIYHFWYQKNSSDIKRNFQNFMYTNKIYPSYLNYYMNLYKNYKSFNCKYSLDEENNKKVKGKNKRKKNSHIKQNTSVRSSSSIRNNSFVSGANSRKGASDLTHRKKKSNELSDHASSGDGQHSGRSRCSYHSDRADSANSADRSDRSDQSFSDHELKRRSRKLCSKGNRREEEFDQQSSDRNDVGNYDQNDDESDEEIYDQNDDENDEDSDEENYDKSDYESDNTSDQYSHSGYDSDVRVQRKRRGKKRKKQKKNTPDENNLIDILNSNSSDISDVMDNNYKDEPFNINIKEKYIYLSKGKKRKSKLFLPSHIKIKKLSACECILLELILKNDILNVLKKYRIFKMEKYEFLYVNLIAMLKHYNYFSAEKLEEDAIEKQEINKYSSAINGTNNNLRKISNHLDNNCIKTKNDKINILKKICDKNLLYYINMQLKNISHLLSFNEIEIACAYLNHIKNNLYVMFQMPILLFNLLFDKIVTSYNHFIILENFFNNSCLYCDFRYEYIFKTKIAYMLIKKFFALDDIENSINCALYFEHCRVKAQKNNIYNDYIFHKSLINAYIIVHEDIVPAEWIEAKNSKDGELNDMNNSEYLDYYSFFFKDISKYIKFHIMDKIITGNIFSLHKQECTNSDERKASIDRSNRGSHSRSDNISSSANNKGNTGNNNSNGGNNDKNSGNNDNNSGNNDNNSGNNDNNSGNNDNNSGNNGSNSRNNGSQEEKKFSCYFLYMVNKSLLDDLLNIYSSKGEYFYKRCSSALINNVFVKDYDKVHNKHFHMYVQLANINNFMKKIFSEYINFFKKKELYHIDKTKNEDEIMENLVNVIKSNGKKIALVINTLVEIIRNIEKRIIKDVNIYITINIRNLIIDTFYLFKYIFNNKEFSLNLVDDLYRNLVLFNDIINSAFSDDLHFYPKEQIKELYIFIKHKFTHQNMID
ncbi:conserved Plasmodium protein, unknown function [Plasmodium malariae]|uniref:Uncharacterized protein n=1 Tax=Plasmodium malariae TaxID=5858 RepID=A0A1C3L1P4_PLAMA|nr:conserved Plasmodium protein, unknown function [Plasmodium malariae]